MGEALRPKGSDLDKILSELHLHEAPAQVLSGRVNQELTLTHAPGYEAVSLGSSGGWEIVLDTERTAHGVFIFVYKGLVGTIRYRDPTDDRRKGGTSSELLFAIVKSTRKDIRGGVAFVLPKR